MSEIEFAPLPDKKYSIIYADPPWRHQSEGRGDKSGGRVMNRFFDIEGRQYQTVPTKELVKLPVWDIADDDCLLFL